MSRAVLSPVIVGLLAFITASTAASTATAGESASAADGLEYRRPRIVVWDLTLDGAAEKEGHAVTASVTRWASKNPHLEVLSQQEIADLLSVETTRLMAGLPDEGRLTEIAQKLDANLVIFGRLTRTPDAYVAHLQLFEAKTATALHREKVALKTLANVDKDLGRAANALVGRVLDTPGLDVRMAAASLVDQLPAEVFTKKSAQVSAAPPFVYWTSHRGSRPTSPLGEQLAAEVGGAIRARGGSGRFTLNEGHSLAGSYRENHDMIEVVLVVQGKGGAEVARAQARIVRGSLDEKDIVPRSLTADADARAKAAATAGQAQELVVDAFTEKGRLDVVFMEGETFHVYMKMNKPGYLRLIYHLADGLTEVLMEDAYPVLDDQAGRVMRYHESFAPAPPYGVERIEVLGYVEKPPPVTTVEREVGGATYPVIEKTRGFMKRPRSRAEIVITTTPR